MACGSWTSRSGSEPSPSGPAPGLRIGTTKAVAPKGRRGGGSSVRVGRTGSGSLLPWLREREREGQPARVDGEVSR